MRVNRMSDFLRESAIPLVLLVTVLLFSLGTGGKILYPQNINNLISQNAYVFVLSAGMLLCLLTGGNVDLAVGSLVCLTGAIGAVLMSSGLPAWLAALLMLGTGLVAGAFQGFWIGRFHVPAFIATLAGMYAYRGLANKVLGGFTVSVTDQSFLRSFGGGADCYVPDFLGGNGFNRTCMAAGILISLICVFLALRRMKTRREEGSFPWEELIRLAVKCAFILFLSWKLAQYRGIPTALLWIGAVLLIYGYITNRTKVGRHLYAVGGNEKAAGLMGVNTPFVTFFAYANMGLLAGLAGILTLARSAAAQPAVGQGYEMDAIAACFIGGVSAWGGSGRISGALVGAILMGVIDQGMSIMGMDSNYQSVVRGLVLLAAVMFDVLSGRENK